MAYPPLPDMEGDKPAKRAFKAYAIGFFHIDIAEVRTAEGKLYLFVAIDQQVRLRATGGESHARHRLGLPGGPDRSRSLPDPHGADRQRHPVLLSTALRRWPDRQLHHPMFDMRCRENGIKHRLTKPNHPWTNGQVERMNRTIKDATVKRYHHDDHNQLPGISCCSSRCLQSSTQAQDPARPHANSVQLEAVAGETRFAPEAAAGRVRPGCAVSAGLNRSGCQVARGQPRRAGRRHGPDRDRTCRRAAETDHGALRSEA